METDPPLIIESLIDQPKLYEETKIAAETFDIKKEIATDNPNEPGGLIEIITAATFSEEEK